MRLRDRLTDREQVLFKDADRPPVLISSIKSEMGEPQTPLLRLLLVREDVLGEPNSERVWVGVEAEAVSARIGVDGCGMGRGSKEKVVCLLAE